MDYAIKKLPKSEVEIKITVPDEKIQIFYKKAAEEISRDYQIKGFRPGNVPPHILEQYVDKKLITAHAHQLAIQNTYADIAIKEKIQVVSRPKIKVESETPLTFTATVAILPEVEIKDHKSIKVKLEYVKVKPDEIEEVLNDMKKYGTTYTDVDRAAKKRDRVEIDFEGFDEHGAAVPNTKSTNHPVIIGDNTLVPGFEDELVGMKKDEKKEFDIKFPKNYAKESFREKKLHFKVEMKRIEEPHAPEIDEALIEKMTGKKQPLAEFREEISKNIKSRKEEEAKTKQENEYLEAVLKKMKVELPESLIEEESASILEDMKDDIEKKGHEFAKFLEQAKTTEEELLKKYRGEAERRIKIRLALQFLLKEEKIEVTDQDLSDELEKIKSFYPADQHAKIQKDFESGGMKNQLTNRLSLNKLFAKVLRNP